MLIPSLYASFANPRRGFLWRVIAICAISLIPPYAGKLIRRTMKPPSYRKVQSI
jgi:phospholipid-translocating ATPase